MQQNLVQLTLAFVQRFIDQDDKVKAIDGLYLGLMQIPHAPELLRLLGRLCLEMQRLEEAHTAFERLRMPLPNDEGCASALAWLANRPREIATSPLAYGHGRVRFFSVHALFKDADTTSPLWTLLGQALLDIPGLAFYGPGSFLDRLVDAVPGLAQTAGVLVADDPGGVDPAPFAAIVGPDCLPDHITTVFLCETRIRPRLEMLYRLPERVKVIDAGLLSDHPRQDLVNHGWTRLDPHIYPMRIPPITVEPDLDVLILDCPARNLALVPNGLGFVSNALMRTELKYQILDADIISYHRYEHDRLFDGGGKLFLSNGQELPKDPWKGEDSGVWERGEILEHFEPEIQELVEKIVSGRPKVLGLSVHACNVKFSTELVKRVRERWPEVVIICGGFNCYNPAIGLAGFPVTDYMCIGEADLTIGPLCESLVRGERPIDVPGVISRFDTPGRLYVPGPMEHNLDRLGYPKYEWANLKLYRNYDGYQLTPIIASRGCRWSRCTFCAERFYWRIRSAPHFVDEVEWLIGEGARTFMFSESDLNGMPQRLMEICDEIQARKLKAGFIGQLRISTHSDAAFFQNLADAGFHLLRFGVDAFSDNTLRLQQKGYTLDTVRRNIIDCANTGIRVTLNWVVGVPGETRQDLEEGIAFLAEMKPYVNMVENINPLMLANGGMYWMEPEKYNIHFSEPKEELYAKYPQYLPANAWWSEEPFIDNAERTWRFDFVVAELARIGIPFSRWTDRIIDDVRTGRDAWRSVKEQAAQ